MKFKARLLLIVRSFTARAWSVRRSLEFSSAWWGAASAFFLNAISFVALIVALLMIPPRPRGTVEEEKKRASGIKDGFRYVAKDKPSLAMIGLIAATTFFIFPIITVMMPLYVRVVLRLGADQLGFLMGASGGRFSGRRNFSDQHSAQQAGADYDAERGIVAVAIFSLSRAPSFYLATALLIFNSLGLAMNFGLANTIVQEHAPDYLRGRVSAVFMLSFVGLMPVAGLDHWSIRSDRNAYGAGDCGWLLRCDRD